MKIKERVKVVKYNKWFYAERNVLAYRFISLNGEIKSRWFLSPFRFILLRSKKYRNINENIYSKRKEKFYNKLCQEK